MVTNEEVKEVESTVGKSRDGWYYGRAVCPSVFSASIRPRRRRGLARIQLSDGESDAEAAARMASDKGAMDCEFLTRGGWEPACFLCWRI